MVRTGPAWFSGCVNPALKKVLYGALAAVLGALATYFATGCSPSQIQRAESAADREIAKAACVKAVVEAYDDQLADATGIRASDVRAFKAELEACLKPAPAPVGDAGL